MNLQSGFQHNMLITKIRFYVMICSRPWNLLTTW